MLGLDLLAAIRHRVSQCAASGQVFVRGAAVLVRARIAIVATTTTPSTIKGHNHARSRGQLTLRLARSHSDENDSTKLAIAMSAVMAVPRTGRSSPS